MEGWGQSTGVGVVLWRYDLLGWQAGTQQQLSGGHKAAGEEELELQNVRLLCLLESCDSHISGYSAAAMMGA